MSRQRLTPELAERLGLSQQVVNELVTEAMVIQGAANEGVLVSDDELRATIQQIREFQEDGRFSREEYLKVLKQLRLDPGEFETEVRRQLVRRKMETLIKQGVKVVRRGGRSRPTASATSACAPRGPMRDVKPAMAAVQVADADLEPYVKTPPAAVQPARAAAAAVRAGRPQEPAAAGSRTRRSRPTTRSTRPSSRSRSASGSPTCCVRVPPVGGSDAENAAKAKVEDVIKRARGRRGLRQARAGDLGGQGQRGPGRRPRLRGPRGAGGAVRAGRVRAEEGRRSPIRFAPPSATTRSGSST